MKIRYSEFCLNPTLRGTTTHLPAHRAQALLDSGAAVEVPMPARGTKEWHAAMKELEEIRQASLPADQPYPSPTWSVHLLREANKYVVKFNHLTTQLIYGPPPKYGDPRGDAKAFVASLKRAGCPKEIIEQWTAKVNEPDYLAQERQRIEKEKVEQIAQQERERNAPRFI
jgi:hypothetical protein